MLKRLRNLLVIAGTAGVSLLPFHESGRDARGPRRDRASIAGLLFLASAVVACLILFPLEVLARVGGGGSYSGGGGSGGGGGGGGGGAIIAVVRMLVWLTVEYPAVGVPVDIVVVGFVVYRLGWGGKKASETFSSARLDTSTESVAFPLGLDTTAPQPQTFNREFAQLRKFDPNF